MNHLHHWTLTLILTINVGLGVVQEGHMVGPYDKVPKKKVLRSLLENITKLKSPITFQTSVFGVQNVNLPRV